MLNPTFEGLLKFKIAWNYYIVSQILGLISMWPAASWLHIWTLEHVLYAFVEKQKEWKLRKFSEEGKKCSYKLMMRKGAQYLNDTRIMVEIILD
jgi:hypothetical protein